MPFLYRGRTEPKGYYYSKTNKSHKDMKKHIHIAFCLERRSSDKENDNHNTRHLST